MQAHEKCAMKIKKKMTAEICIMKIWCVFWAKNHFQNLIETKQFDCENRSNFTIDQTFRLNFSIEMFNRSNFSIEMFNRSNFSIEIHNHVIEL